MRLLGIVLVACLRGGAPLHAQEPQPTPTVGPESPFWPALASLVRVQPIDPAALRLAPPLTGLIFFNPDLVLVAGPPGVRDWPEEALVLFNSTEPRLRGQRWRGRLGATDPERGIFVYRLIDPVEGNDTPELPPGAIGPAFEPEGPPAALVGFSGDPARAFEPVLLSPRLRINPFVFFDDLLVRLDAEGNLLNIQRRGSEAPLPLEAFMPLVLEASDPFNLPDDPTPTPLPPPTWAPSPTADFPATPTAQPVPASPTPQSPPPSSTPPGGLTPVPASPLPDLGATQTAQALGEATIGPEVAATLTANAAGDSPDGTPTPRPFGNDAALLTVEWPMTMGTSDSRTILLMVDASQEDPLQVTVTSAAGGTVSTPVTVPVPDPNDFPNETLTVQATLSSPGLRVQSANTYQEGNTDGCGTHVVSIREPYPGDTPLKALFVWNVAPCPTGATRSLTDFTVRLEFFAEQGEAERRVGQAWQLSKAVTVHRWPLPTGLSLSLGLLLLGGAPLAAAPYLFYTYRLRKRYPGYRPGLIAGLTAPTLPESFDPAEVPPQALRKAMFKAFDTETLRQLTFDLLADCEEFHFDNMGERYSEQLISVIDFCENLNRYRDLVRTVATLRPDLVDDLMWATVAQRRPTEAPTP